MEERVHAGCAEAAPAPTRTAVEASVGIRSRATDIVALQRSIGNRAVTRLIQRQGSAGASASPPDPVKQKVESYFKSLAGASDLASKTEYALKAVWAVIRAFKFSTIGLAGIQFEPDFKKTYPDHEDALAITFDAGRAQSRVVFGPDAFTEYVTFVHVVAHELEHVRQRMFGTYRVAGTVTPVKEFLAYCGMVLQVGPTSSGKRRGLLAELRAAPTENLPRLPPLDVAGLWQRSAQVMGLWRTMLPAERRTYFADFEAVRDKLFERIQAEAPKLLRPPNSDRSSPEFKRWYDGIIPAPAVIDPADPNYDPMSTAFTDWEEASHSLWAKVRDVWKEFDQWQLPTAKPAGAAAGR
jgi:hypothetical protein